MAVLLLNSNAKHIPLADNSVNCVVTSPPYYGLRDYGTAEWVGGKETRIECPECHGDVPFERGPTGWHCETCAGNGYLIKPCEHTEGEIRTGLGLAALGEKYRGGGHKQGEVTKLQYKSICPHCGAVRVDNQIGLEQSPDDYVAAMVAVFREVWRVLRDDGVVFLNLGDSYAGGGGASGHTAETTNCGRKTSSYGAIATGGKAYGLKPKDLIGIPWRVAFALQADGWYLRQDIIWHKPNPMPESVKDRCTKAHEYIFLLTKSARYFCDMEAIKEDYVSEPDPIRDKSQEGYNNSFAGGRWSAGARDYYSAGGRNKRSVWTVTTKPYSGAHYAVFPPDLIEPCVLAGCPETVCAKCGAPYERVVERTRPIPGQDIIHYSGKGYNTNKGVSESSALRSNGPEYNKWKLDNPDIDKGFEPTCDCNAGTRPGVVLDPFIGSGTTCMVARKHRRHGIGLDLNFEYLTTNARERLTYGEYVPVADGINQLTLPTDHERTNA